MENKSLIHKFSIPIMFLCSILFVLLFQMVIKTGNNNIYKYIFLFGILISCFLAVYWKFKDQLSFNKILVLLFILAFLSRLTYVSIIGINTNQHDTNLFSNLENNYGHTGYIRYLFDNWSLPDFDVRGKSQFYHPPLHHILCAVWLKIQTVFGISFEDATENLQALTLFYSMATMYAVHLILKQFNVKEYSHLFALALIGFHPTFYLLSGSINNDALSICLIFYAFWATIRWYRKPTYRNIILIALFIGLSMMAKLATGVIAFAVAFLFLYKFIKEKGMKEKLKMVPKFIVFGIICIPLGIGWQLRNFIEYGVPLTYVPRLSDTSNQYLGNYSVLERFFDFNSLSDYGVFPMREGKLGAEYFEHNIPLAALKTSLFGEYYSWKESTFFTICGTILFWITVILIVIFLISLVYSTIKMVKNKSIGSIKMDRAEFLFILIYFFTILISYVSFCFAYPHFCSMDFRYIVPLLIFFALFIGIGHQQISEKLQIDKNNKKLNILFNGIGYFCATFCVLSVVMYPLFYK